jgi:predicted lipoprotein with Yx(FWY)xxD motif
MNRPARHGFRPSSLGLAAFAALAAALIVTGGSAAAKATKVVAKEVESATLGKTVLANNAGRTLYSLSAEKNGRFVCTGAGCLAAWHPLLVAANTKPTGPVKLGKIGRPDGRTQVTYQGLPLYTFSGDSKRGDANGEGIKDVGTWHAATLGKRPSPPAEPQPTLEPPSPYPY